MLFKGCPVRVKRLTILFTNFLSNRSRTMGFLSTVPSDQKTSIEDIHHDNFVSTTVYGSHVAGKNIPRFELGEEEMPARTAMRLVHDELLMVSL